MRWNADIVSALLVSVLSIVVGGTVLVADLSRPESDILLVPTPVWAALFLFFLIAQTGCIWMVDSVPGPAPYAAFATMTALSPVLLLMAPSAGWLPILPVFTASLAAYFVGTGWVIGIIAMNTIAITAAAAQVMPGQLELATMTVLYLALQITCVVSVAAQRNSERMQVRLGAAHAELMAASAMLAESERADERLRISRELHDLIGHTLTAMALELEVASHQAEPPAKEHVQRARGLAGDLLTDVRTAVGELRRRTPALKDSLERMTTDLPGLDVRVSAEGPLDIDEERTLALLRSAQEIVTNAIRHSGARSLELRVRADEAGTVVLDGRDDGTGAREFVPGNGLTGLAERAAALGGRMECRSDAGFHVTVRLPLREEAAA